MAGGATVWVARWETRNTQSMAFGPTAARALENLVAAWVERHCPPEGADPALPWEEREGIELNPVDPDRGYVLGTGDGAWLPAGLRGDAEGLAGTWDALAARYGIDPGAGGPSP